MSGWTSVHDALPETTAGDWGYSSSEVVVVLVVDNEDVNPLPLRAYYIKPPGDALFGPYWSFDEQVEPDVTHWMPLPKETN